MNAEQSAMIRRHVGQLDSMPTVPAVIQPLMQLLQVPPEAVDVTRVKELISFDNVIAAQCLRMANSPLFGRRNVESVHDAVVTLGLKRIQAIVIGCSLNQLIRPTHWGFAPAVFWKHELGCAIVSRKLAQLVGYHDPEKAYVAGLLHDIGILVNSIVCADQFRECIEWATSVCMDLHRAEDERLGFNHCQSGRILADHWHIPQDLCDVIEFHDDVAVPNTTSLVALVHISDLLCRVRELGYGYYEVMGVDFAGSDAWKILREQYSNLANMDLARFTMDIDAMMPEIQTLVESIFAST